MICATYNLYIVLSEETNVVTCIVNTHIDSLYSCGHELLICTVITTTPIHGCCICMAVRVCTCPCNVNLVICPCPHWPSIWCSVHTSTLTAHALEKCSLLSFRCKVDCTYVLYSTTLVIFSFIFFPSFFFFLFSFVFFFLLFVVGGLLLAVRR